MMDRRKESSVSAVPYAGIDLAPDQRPGVPMETKPRPMGNAHWREPERQIPEARVLKRAALDELTPVFSNALPPRLLSGVLRRYAYTVPEHFVRHWAVLLLADRVDVLENRIAHTLRFALPIAALAGVGLYVASRSTRRRRWGW